MRERRRNALAQVLLNWRAHFSETATINIEQKQCEIYPGGQLSLDIFVLVSGEDHFLDVAFEKKFGLRRAQVTLEEPRMLPFAAHRLMADQVDHYDWFVYSEDDLVIRQADFFKRQHWFRKSFGPMCLLQPNRYEINPRGTRWKTYVDGAIRRRNTDPYFAKLAADTWLEGQWMGEALRFERTRNPHAGFFALSQQQLRHWMSCPHFLDLDCSFIGPLESAATLGLLKTFPVYKAHGSAQSFCELEHLDTKFSALRFPAFSTQAP